MMKSGLMYWLTGALSLARLVAHEALARQYLAIARPAFAFQGIGFALYFAAQGGGNVVLSVAMVAYGLVSMSSVPLGWGRSAPVRSPE